MSKCNFCLKISKRTSVYLINYNKLIWANLKKIFIKPCIIICYCRIWACARLSSTCTRCLLCRWCIRFFFIYLSTYFLRFILWCKFIYTIFNINYRFSIMRNFNWTITNNLLQIIVINAENIGNLFHYIHHIIKFHYVQIRLFRVLFHQEW